LTAVGGAIARYGLEGAQSLPGFVTTTPNSGARLSPDHQLLAVAGPVNAAFAGAAVGPIRLVPVGSARDVVRISPPPGRAFAAVSFSADSTRLVTSDNATVPGDTDLRVWDVRTGREAQSAIHVDRFVPTVALVQGSNLVAGVVADFQSPDAELITWRPNGETASSALFAIGSPSAPQYQFAFDPTGHRLAAADGQYRITLWDTLQTRRLAGARDTLDPNVQQAPRGGFVAGGRRLVIASDREFVILDGYTLRMIAHGSGPNGTVKVRTREFRCASVSGRAISLVGPTRKSVATS
jgi:WD40 repeat protein